MDTTSIKTVLFYYLRYESIFQYLCLYRDLLIAYPEVKAIIGIDLDAFAELLLKYLNLLDSLHGNELSKAIAEADKLVDRYVVGINSVVDAAVHHFDPQVVEAGESIAKRLKALGKIESKPYEEESAAIKVLSNELRNEEYAAKAELIGLTPWIDNLDVAETEFETLFKLRNTQFAGKLEGMNIKELNKQIFPVYRRMIGRLNTALILNSTPALVEFANELNKQIDYANEHGDHRTAKITIENIIVKPIEPQLETEKPITYMPELSIEIDEKQVELVFSEDYTLTYKNNIKPGVAEIIISGKGRFKGKKVVTFIILTGLQDLQD
jgi:hypothetical protein